MKTTASQVKDKWKWFRAARHCN